MVRSNWYAIRFLLVFVGVYLTLNTMYAFYIEHYRPSSDPFTQSIAKQAAVLLRAADPSIQITPSASTPFVSLYDDRGHVIDVFEGCNGINVMVVYISFLLAFWGSWRLLAMFAVGGMVVIHAMNLIRITLLFGVVCYFPDQLYFFHKYLFTGVIYVVVFVLWYFWVKRVKNYQSA